jgi:hypothetical protein
MIPQDSEILLRADRTVLSRQLTDEATDPK